MNHPPSKKRKPETGPVDSSKRLKMTDDVTLSAPIPPAATGNITQPSHSTVQTNPQVAAAITELHNDTKISKGKGKEKERSDIQTQNMRRIKKLVPPRPFATVPPSVSATGPRSSHREGKNMICLTRKTSLGTYMRRCKDVIIKDGYKTLHLSAMGAAIPLLLQLVAALPPILPFTKDEIRYDIKTGTVEVRDEVIPEDEDEDISYQTRGKSTLSVIFRIGDGEFEGDRTAVRKYSAGKSVGKSFPRSTAVKNNTNKTGKAKSDTIIIYEEPEQEFMDML